MLASVAAGLRRRHGCGEIVAQRTAVAEKRLIHHAAHRVAAVITGVTMAKAIPEPAGEGLAAAELQGLTQHVETAALHRPLMRSGQSGEGRPALKAVKKVRPDS